MELRHGGFRFDARSMYAEAAGDPNLTTQRRTK